MSRILVICLLVMGVSVHAGETLHVKQGQTHQWGANDNLVILKEMILEDNSVIALPPGLE